MSYDCRFGCGDLPKRHQIKGGTHVLGGTTEPWLNITWNYSKWYYRLWPEGLYALGGLPAELVRDELEAKLPLLDGKPTDDYWEATEGNAKKALEDLLALAALVPDGAILEVS